MTIGQGVIFAIVFVLLYVAVCFLALIFGGLDGLAEEINNTWEIVERDPSVLLAPFALSFTYSILGVFSGIHKK